MKDLDRAQLNDWYAFVARKPCLYPGCLEARVELHHIRLFRSEKTGSVLPRRHGLNKAAVIPLCHAHHRTGPDAAHNSSEVGWLAELEENIGEEVRDLICRWLAVWAFVPSGPLNGP